MRTNKTRCKIFEKKIQHLDLARRNILCNIPELETPGIELSKSISFNKERPDSHYVNCLIADYGMSKISVDGSDQFYHQQSQTAKFPIKWSDYNRFTYGKTTNETDLWSLSCIVDELFYFPHKDQPYIHLYNDDYKKNVTGFYNNQIQIQKLRENLLTLSPANVIKRQQTSNSQFHEKLSKQISDIWTNLKNSPCVQYIEKKSTSKNADTDNDSELASLLDEIKKRNDSYYSKLEPNLISFVYYYFI